MSFFPSPHHSFSPERHLQKSPPALITHQPRRYQNDSFTSIVSPKASPSSSLSKTTRFRSSTSCSSPLYSLEIISLVPPPDLTSTYLSLILRLQNSPGTTQKAILLYQEETTLWYSPLSTTNNTPLNSPTHLSTNHQICNPAQYEKLSKIFSKTPQSIFQNANFGNPWYVLEVQETYHGEPHFALVATYHYQLLLSSLKHPSQLRLCKPDGLDNYSLYDRFSLTYKVEKLGKLSLVGYLGGDDTEDNTKRVFIKMLDLGAGLEERGGASDRETALNLVEQVDQIYHEINLLCSMPLHPHITLPPIGYVTLGSEEGEEREGRKIIGFVGEYYKNGRLSDYLFLPGEPGKPRVIRPITLLQKAKWALQITSVVMHLHRKAGMSMGDERRGFGLERFLVDDFLQLHLTGFGTGKKVSRLSWRVPPEARIRGEWDVSMETANGRGSHGIGKLIWKRNNYVRLRWKQDNLTKLIDVEGLNPTLPSTLIPSVINSIVDSANNNEKRNSYKSYKSYDNNSDRNITIMEESTDKKIGESSNYVNDRSKGSYVGGGNGERQLAQEGRIAKIDNDWSAFEKWRSIPRALEIVETYSLGVMLWLLFEQIPSDTLPEDGRKIFITWMEDRQIPREWRVLVEACVETDPADRIGLGEVLRAFVAEVGKCWDGGSLMG